MISADQYFSNKTKSVSINKDFLQDNLYTSYSKLFEVKLLNVGMASPGRIRQWAEKTLPNGKVIGQVTNANTLHHKTFKPQKGGLFCERVFGPIKDFECACGKSQKPNEEEQKRIIEHQQTERKYCPICDVEYTWSVIRRYQLGYIQLASPVTHIWYLKGSPSYLSIVLDIGVRELEKVVYFEEGTIKVDEETGEAYFEVTKDPHSPFTVKTKSGNVTVLGSQYAIRIRLEAEKQNQ